MNSTVFFMTPSTVLLCNMKWLLLLACAVEGINSADPSVPVDNDQYTRCKQTHRCGWGFSDYDVVNAVHEFNSTIFENGEHVKANLFADFEDWMVGARGWQEKIQSSRFKGHFDSIALDLLGPLETSMDEILNINTTSLECIINYSNGTVIQNFTGQELFTNEGTPVAVFNFDYVSLSSQQVNVFGGRALAVMSRSSIHVNTHVDVPAGQLGGFMGAHNAGTINSNGPGSSSRRVYLYTVKVVADDINEIQTVASSAYQGQTLSGSFNVVFDGHKSMPIPHNASPDLFRARLERTHASVGKVTVTRSGRSDEGGYTWFITFETAVGDVPQLMVESELVGIDAQITSSTIQQGNSISGYFKLEFQNNESDPLLLNSTSRDLETTLLNSFSSVDTVFVQRSDATTDTPVASRSTSGRGKCDNGLCSDGPGQARGLAWTILLTTSTLNVSPTWPLDDPPAEKASTLTATLLDHVGVNVVVHVESGHTLSHAETFNGINISSPFTLTYGGWGGSYGTQGEGVTSQVEALTYNDRPSVNTTYLASAHVTNMYGDDISADLLGGSGGGIGGFIPRDIVMSATGIGGAGGGAIEFIAVNDIVINGSISVLGQDGTDGSFGGGGGSGGTIILAAGSVVYLGGAMNVTGGKAGMSFRLNSTSVNHGGLGRIGIFSESLSSTSFTASSADTVQTAMDAMVHVDHTLGAAATTSSLRLHIPVSTPLRKGPVYKIRRESAVPKPGRVSLFFRVDHSNGREGKWKGHVGLFAEDERDETMIGTGIYQGYMHHDANFMKEPTHKLSSQIIVPKRWYKLDIFIDWTKNQYTLRLNDIEYATDKSFVGMGVDAIGFFGSDSSTVWFDEVYVGNDDTQSFRCPIAAKQDVIHHSTQVDISIPQHINWNSVHSPTTYFNTSHHQSHLSNREYFQNYEFDTGGLHRRFFMDVPEEEPDKNVGRLTRSSLVHSPYSSETSEEILQRSRTSAGTDWTSGPSTGDGLTGRYFWFEDHVNHRLDEYLYGGIMACSTSDFVHWRFEGTMLHFNNISYDGGVPRLRVDLHGGVDGVGTSTAGKHHTVEIPVEETVGVGNWSGVALKSQSPKVIYNNLTQKYVMWSQVFDDSNELGVTLVASSDYPGGPFVIHDTFLPDGNETHDQSVFKKGDKAYLVRTYFTTVDYVLPEPVMQPIWESVKNANGDVDFGLNYYRSDYKQFYDDSNDICIQRLRMEDKPEQIDIIPETIPEEKWIKNSYSGDGRMETYVVNEQALPWIEKNIVGQGVQVIDSRFKNPNSTENNAWQAASVPTVKSQSWSSNFMDANIADNPIHSTLPDKLIGPPQIVEQRKSKYVAISLLTPDFLQTSGVLTVVEGYGDQLLADIIKDDNMFNLEATVDPIHYPRMFFPDTCQGGIEDDEWEDCNAPTEQLQESTAPGQVWGLSEPFNFKTEYDWSWRYHQYRWNLNDLHDAPVNYVDQLVDWFEPGRGASRTTRGRDFIRLYDYNCYRGPNDKDQSDPEYLPADDLYMHELSQHYTKTENADIDSTTKHLIFL